MTRDDLEARLEALEDDLGVGDKPPAEWMKNVPRQFWGDPTAAWRYYVSEL